METVTVGPIGLWAVIGLAGVAVVLAPRSRGARSLGGKALAVAAVVSTGLLIRLAYAFAAQDWTLVYVADNTRSGVGPLLRVAGLWAGPQGSLLLWTTMVAWVAVLSVARAEPACQTWTVRLGAGLVGAYGLVVALAASPFDRLELAAVDGLGLQPVLEYPAMVWHPPLLYAGLVGLLAPAITAGAAVAAGRPVAVHPRLVAVPLGLLSAGLVSGALWANMELGWGGYWAWDPIESAGLVAWCCGAAALHGLRRAEPRVVDSRRVEVAVVMAPGLAAIWATTLTRIGVISSVHAFADQPRLRIGLLAVAALVSGVSAALVVAAHSLVKDPAGAGPRRTPADGAGPPPWVGHRRLAVAVLAVAALFVAVGTYEPLVEAATSGHAVAIAGHYFSRLLWPLVMVGAGLAVRADRRWWPALAGAVVALVLAPEGGGPYGWLLSGAGGAMAGSGLARRGRGTVAHFGVGLLLVGVAGTTVGRVDVVELTAGSAATFGGVELEHQSLDLVESGVTREAVATVLVDGAELHPRLVAYQLRGVSTAEVAHRFRGLDEIQVVLIDGQAGRARYQVNQLPRVGLVWLGGLVGALGLLGYRLGTGRLGSCRLGSCRLGSDRAGMTSSAKSCMERAESSRAIEPQANEQAT